ncbi:hypothetical protein YC2023_017918 [Brassica napus]
MGVLIDRFMELDIHDSIKVYEIFSKATIDQLNGPQRVKARSEHSSSKWRLQRSRDRGTIAEIAERLLRSRSSCEYHESGML